MHEEDQEKIPAVHRQHTPLNLAEKMLSSFFSVSFFQQIQVRLRFNNFFFLDWLDNVGKMTPHHAVDSFLVGNLGGGDYPASAIRKT